MNKTLVWLGGIVLVSAAVGGIAYAATHAATSTPSNPPAPPPPAPGPSPLPAPALVSSWSPGNAYIFTSQVPTGVASSDALLQLLAANGWTNVVILFYGPTGALVSGAVQPFQTNATTYVASGTWNGATTPVPTGVQSVLMSAASGQASVTLAPGANALSVKTGATISIGLPPGGAWVSLTSPGGTALSVAGTVPAQVTINVTGVLTAVYTDTTGTQQTATLNVTAT